VSDATITHAGGSIVARSLSEYRASHPAGTIPHPISNSADLDYTFRPFDRRTGSFALVFATAPEADAAVAVLTTPQVLTLESVARPGVNMAFIIAEGSAVDLEPGAAGETLVRVGFQEVAP
jgi:hypothetical protein